MKLAATILALTLGVASPGMARQAAPVASVAPIAAGADVASADAIIAALYDVISGEAGAARDWDRFQSLFVPGATLGGVGRGPDGRPRLRPVSPADYIARNSSHFAAQPFYEREIGRRVDGFGPVVNVLSAFQIANAPGAAEALQRGVNAIQLMNDGQRWWVVSVIWTGETAETPIPADLLAHP